ncbi:MAG: histidine kinase dimerization/phospho-acceptor domain-containing protein [Pseudomonadota bacterium]
MKFKTRLTLSFGIFAFVLCVLFASLLGESLTTVEDQLAASLLEQEASYLVSRYRENPDSIVMPDLEQLKGYLSDQSDLPKWLESLEVGFHQTNDFHVLVEELDDGRHFYLVYDETRGVLDQHNRSLLFILVVLVLLVSAVGVAIGAYQAAVLARPVNKLAEQVKSVNTENPRIMPLAAQDEIGQLSHVYADLVDRLAQFIQREKAFTRYASHELMTPISILNNNLELLHNPDLDSEMRDRAIERLHHAVQQMQRQIEIFLMLAREENIEPAAQPLDWTKLLKRLVSQFPQVSLSLEVLSEPVSYIAEPIVQTILTNALGNVVKHGLVDQGEYKAVLVLQKNRLQLSNEISKAPGDTQSRFGFGLEINQKLCQAIGWRFSASRENSEFFVTLEFD